MRFQLSASGTVSECRESLNREIAKLAGPHKQEFAVIRAVAHYVVEENLDPLYVPWAESLNALRAGSIPQKNWPAEPQTSFSIDLDIKVEELARQ